MPTCRTCEFCYPRYGCSEAKTPLECITTEHDCSAHKPRETPSLVDVLAEALNDMVALYSTADAAGIPVYLDGGFDEVMKAAFAALARHQKEVGDE